MWRKIKPESVGGLFVDHSSKEQIIIVPVESLRGESEISGVASDTNKPHYLCPFTEKKTEEILSIFFTIAVLLKKIGQPFNISIPIFQSCTVFPRLTKKCTVAKNFCYKNCSCIGKY